MELAHPLDAAMPLVPADAFRGAMRELASGVVIVTAGAGGAMRGMTATAVSSVSVEPPTLLVCVNRAADGHGAITAAGAFCVNVIAAEQSSLADHFAGKGGVRGAARFEQGEWEQLETGAPVLRDAVAAFDCRLVQSHDWGTHTIFLGVVVATRTQPGRPSLVYRAGRYIHA